MLGGGVEWGRGGGGKEQERELLFGFAIVLLREAK